MIAYLSYSDSIPYQFEDDNQKGDTYRSMSRRCQPVTAFQWHVCEDLHVLDAPFVMLRPSSSAVVCLLKVLVLEPVSSICNK